MEERLPGYYSHKPQLKVIKKLKKVLGSYDSAPTTIELVLKFFEEENKRTNIQLEDAILNLSTDFHVKAFNIKSFQEIKKQIHYLYIVNAFNVIDPFFRELKSELKKFLWNKEWKTKNGKEDLDAFNQIIENCFKDERKSLKSKPEFFVINYYRLQRNAIVHRAFEENQFDAALSLLSDACFEVVADGLLNYALKNDKIGKQLKGMSNAKSKKKEKPLRKFLSKYFDHDDLDHFSSFYQEYLRAIGSV